MASTLKTGFALANNISALPGGIGTLADDIAAPTPYLDQLQPASWKGVPFMMLGGSGSFGRRNAVHEYPGRDVPYVEDMGRQARRINVTGYLVGNDVIAQRKRMIAACESMQSVNVSNNRVGDVLIHPSYGALTVALLGFNAQERWNNGRYYELTFSFIESGARIFPTAGISIASAATIQAGLSNLAAAAAYVANGLRTLQKGAAVADAAVATAESWVSKAQKIVRDATSLYKTVASLPGNLGRFANAARKGLASTAAPSATTLPDLIAAGVQARSNVAAASSSLIANAGDPAAFATDSQALGAAVLASVGDPAQAVTMLLSLADFPSAYPVLTSPIGAATSSIQNAGADLFRRAAVVAMAQASAQYLPASADDAAAMRSTVCDALEAEMLIAADQGEDDVYTSLKALFATVAQDMAAKGAGLPAITTITTPAPLPSLVLAQRLYCDPTRADELVIEANPIHPAFMPTSFKGLAA